MKNIFVISGPSGSGQDSIIDSLANKLPLQRIITTTTRPIRAGESEEHPYHFVSKEVFADMRKKELFLECAQTYNGEWYGVTKEELAKAASSQLVAIWKVDYKGVQKIKELFPKILTFFIDVPEEILKKRLQMRDNPSEEYLEARMRYTKDWQINKHLYDYIIQNRDGELEKAVAEIKKIIQENAS